ncbi:MAG: hypothetical protein HC834_07915 [Rhodospirillales bacterium]|nr:hypothetical protein [Rhodospirillales bacterium]
MDIFKENAIEKRRLEASQEEQKQAAEIQRKAPCSRWPTLSGKVSAG